MTKLGGWVGEVTRTSRLDFGSGTDPDPAYHWDTKRKLSSLVEVCTLLNAVLVHPRVLPRLVRYILGCNLVYESKLYNTQTWSHHKSQKSTKHSDNRQWIQITLTTQEDTNDYPQQVWNKPTSECEITKAVQFLQHHKQLPSFSSSNRLLRLVISLDSQQHDGTSASPGKMEWEV